MVTMGILLFSCHTFVCVYIYICILYVSIVQLSFVRHSATTSAAKNSLRIVDDGDKSRGCHVTYPYHQPPSVHPSFRPWGFCHNIHSFIHVHVVMETTCSHWLLLLFPLVPRRVTWSLLFRSPVDPCCLLFCFYCYELMTQF